MGYIPQRATDTLSVQLGYAFQASFSAGSNVLNGVGFSFTAADVGNIVMVLSGGVDGLTHVTWSTVQSVTSATRIVLVDNIPDASSAVVNTVLYRALGTGPPASGPYPLTESVELDLTATVGSTGQFTVVSLDGSFIVTVGMPVLIRDTELGIDLFGGIVIENVVTNEPGTKTVYSACALVGWEIICRRRTTGGSDAIADNDQTYGSWNPKAGVFVGLRADQIANYYVTHALFDDGVGENFDTTGPSLPTFASIAAYVSDALDQLCNQSNQVNKQFLWYMSPRRVLNLVTLHTIAAPWNISDVDLSDGNVLMQVQNTKSKQNYFNRGLAEITSLTQSFIGDGVNRAFNLSQAVGTDPSIAPTATLNGTSQTIKINGTTPVPDWYYTPGSTLIVQANGLAPTLTSSDVLTITVPIDDIFQYQDDAAVSAQAVVESGSGLWEQNINLNPVSTTGDAHAAVISLVTQAKDPSQEIQIYTYKPGLLPGQTIQINLKDIGVDSAGSPALGAYFLIDSAKLRTSHNLKLWTITAAADAPFLGPWVTQLKRNLGQVGGVNASVFAIPGGAGGNTSVIPGGAPSAFSSGGGKWIREIPQGTIDGTNKTFTLTYAPNPSFVFWLFLNGIAQDPYWFDFQLIGRTITYQTAPKAGVGSPAIGGDRHWCIYLVGPGGGGGRPAALAFDLYGSGLQSDYSLNAPTANEQHWIMTASADATWKTSVVSSPRPAGWLSNLADAQWISPRPDCTQSVAVGNYTYQQNFDLTGFLPSTASISLQVASDDGISIYLNGVLKYSYGGTATSNYGTLHTVFLNSGFVGGINNLTIVVANSGAGTPNPSGLFVEVQGTAATAV